MKFAVSGQWRDACVIHWNIQTVCRSIENNETSVNRCVATIVRPSDSVGVTPKPVGLFEQVDLMVGVSQGPEGAETGYSGANNSDAFSCHGAKESGLTVQWRYVHPKRHIWRRTWSNAGPWVLKRDSFRHVNAMHA